ncbi:VOC family protein [Rhodococcus sp. ACT016]|uniref:VOC family protein n=1 Tax=Rhodococcus sp. ACT016 TaxID=3134808 RepID=UPI003D2BD5D4
MRSFAAPDVDFELGRLHHVGVVVPDPEAAVLHFEALYGLSIRLFPESEYHCRINGVAHSTVQRLGLTVDGPPHVELLRAVPDSTVWQPSSGIHHLGYVVDDLARASEELERRGSPLWMGGLRDGQCPAGTAYHRDALGLTIELLDHATAARLAARLNES